MNDKQEQVPFSQVLANLLDPGHNFNPKNIQNLSNLSAQDATALQAEWANIPVTRRRSLVSDLATFAEADPLLFFDRIGQIALVDEDPDVRVAAIVLLALEEEPAFANTLVKLLASDAHYLVRAAAAAALGRYMYLCDVETLSAETFDLVENALLTAYRGDPQVLVQRRALESVGYSSHKEVNPLIEDAFGSGDEDWQESALIAMGISANPRWESNVLEMLESESTQLRYEAAAAAGKLGIKEGKQLLLSMAQDDLDSEVRRAALWALTELGGNDVGELIEDMLEEAVADDEIDFLEDAMENFVEAQMLNEMDLPLFDFDEEGLNDLNEIELDE